MRPTEILSAEHRVIEQVLDCVEKIAERGRERGALDVQAATAAIRFLKTFADRCHHGKEEDQLFPAIGERGIPTKVGPVAVMLDEHTLGRREIAAMENAVKALQGNDPKALEQYVVHAGNYVELLREHILKEDNILFPMAEAALSDEDRVRVLAAFEKVESEDLGAGTHEDMLQVADWLAERFEVEKASARVPAEFHGCCHKH
jgi:hemerythrin-like domain-containing protein